MMLWLKQSWSNISIFYDDNFFWCINQFWCELLVYNIWITLFFESLIFPASRKHARRCSVSRRVNETMPGCQPSYLKTVSQQVVCRIRTHSLRFLSLNTAILVGIIQIHTNFGWLKWLVTHQKNLYLGTVFFFYLGDAGIFELFIWVYKLNNFISSILFNVIF